MYITTNTRTTDRKTKVAYNCEQSTNSHILSFDSTPHEAKPSLSIRNKVYNTLCTHTGGIKNALYTFYRVYSFSFKNS